MFLERMNYLQVEEYLKENDSIMIVTGSLENHGKHMPLGTDTLIPERLAEMIEKKIGDKICIAPPLHYGATEDLTGFAGTISLGVDGLYYVLGKICNRLYEYGFRHFIILNGHGGNSKSIEQVGFDLYRKGALLARVDWWLIAGQLNLAWKGGHGGGEETAAIMAIDESLIKKEYIDLGENMRNDLGDQLPSYSWTNVLFEDAQITVVRPIKDITDNGWLSHGMGEDAPTRADAKWGTEMIETVANYTARFIPIFSKTELK